jgi:hypothetical protein
VVRRIFADYLAGMGVKAIAEALTKDGIPSPSAYDPARNPHRCGIAWAWSAVAAILGSPRYTGRQVWNRQRKDEVLLDVHDVALGFTTKQRWNQADDWIWSEQAVHEPLIDTVTFVAGHHDLGVLRCMAAAQQEQPAKDAGHDEIQESDRHRPRSCLTTVQPDKPQVTASASSSGAVQA